MGDFTTWVETRKVSFSHACLLMGTDNACTKQALRAVGRSAGCKSGDQDYLSLSQGGSGSPEFITMQKLFQVASQETSWQPEQQTKQAGKTVTTSRICRWTCARTKHVKITLWRDESYNDFLVWCVAVYLLIWRSHWGVRAATVIKHVNNLQCIPVAR